MSDTPRDLTKCTISNVPGFAGGFTIAAAAPDFLTFGLDDDGLSFKIFVTQPGVGAEIRKGCVFAWNGGVSPTLSRGTMVRSTGVANAALEFGSAALVSVVPSAEDFLTTERVAAFNEMLVNVGTEAVPVWELQANLIPRTGVLTYLTGLLNGGGELCSATDVAGLVQLNGTPGSGTADAYCPMYPGSYYQNTNGRYTVLKPSHPWISTTFQHDLQLTSPDQNWSGLAGKVSIRGGWNTVGSGGGVEVWPGGGGTTKPAGNFTVGSRTGDGVGGFGSNITMTGGNATNSATGGSITLTAGNGTGEGATAGSVNITAGRGITSGTPGKIKFTVDSVTVLELGPTVLTIGFYGAPPVAKPAVTGSKASGAALDSLLTALSTLGLIDISGVTA